MHTRSENVHIIYYRKCKEKTNAHIIYAMLKLLFSQKINANKQKYLKKKMKHPVNNVQRTKYTHIDVNTSSSCM